ncbi:MAG TPA: hypothetical protein PLD71_04290, partial [Syntrophales bacterium]|nr:hypothetical protein [Syntrophales bacterium]
GGYARSRTPPASLRSFFCLLKAFASVCKNWSNAGLFAAIPAIFNFFVSPSIDGAKQHIEA